MKLLVAGSRCIREFNLSDILPQDTDLIISGGADGIDKLAEEYADKKRISKLILRPKCSIYGKRAPIIRNREMVDIADGVIVIWDGKSRGAASTIKYAKEKNKLINLVVVPQP